MSSSPTQTLADFAVRMQRVDLAEDVREKAAVVVLDALGLAMAGASDTTAAATRRILAARQGAATALAWSDGSRLAVLDAVLHNAVCTHALFQDDCDMTSWSHPGSLIVPPALSLADARGASLDVALRAVVAGYAALNWLGADEEVGRAVVSRGLRASPTLGPAAAAVAASVVLGWDADRARHAIGIAADMSGGTLEPVRSGSDDWRIQNGSAAWRGALAALLAGEGVLGSPEALEGPRGFVSAFAGRVAPARWERPPEEHSILQVWEKAFPTLGDNVAVSLAAAELSRLLGDTSGITGIVVHQNAEFASYPGTSFRGPFERRAQGMASTAFAVAVALLRGEITPQAYDEELGDPEVARLVEVLTVRPEPAYDYTDGMVEVTSDGRVFRVAARDLPRTLMFRDADEARRVFREVAGRHVGEVAASGFSEAVLEAVDGEGSASLGWLLQELTAPLRESWTT